MESRDFVRAIRMLLALAVLQLGMSVMMPCYAESGSSQAIMSLFVPPSDANMAAIKVPVTQNAPMFNRYDEDTNISLTQKSGSITYRVWVAI